MTGFLDILPRLFVYQSVFVSLGWALNVVNLPTISCTTDAPEGSISLKLGADFLFRRLSGLTVLNHQAHKTLGLTPRSGSSKATVSGRRGFRVKR